ncbi:MAG: sulfatase-like hydrolase/transferase [Mariniblastus sp.]|nr:sulfatase-like hydrolase/transferase [Mariniblastus sp.]
MNFLFAFTLCLTIGPTLQAARVHDLDSSNRQPVRPNLVVIMADDLGYRDLGCYGCIDFQTPNIDRLAQRGIRCTNGYVSHPYCSPSRAGVLSGRYQQTFGHESNPPYNEKNSEIGIDPATRLLPDLFQQAGYVTGLIGKWHLGAGQPFRPNRRGFTQFYGFLGGGHHYFKTTPGGKDYESPMWRNDEPTNDTLTYLTDDLTGQAEQFLDQHRSEPFCLFLMYNAPHSPDHVTERYLERVDHIQHAGRRKYAALVQGVDEGVKRVLARLEQLQLTETTLVVFLSDNGGRRGVADNRPLRGNKGWLHEGGIRVPLIFSMPGTLPQDSTLDLPVSALDILPTALGLAGLETPADVDGVDLVPCLRSESTEPPHPTLYWRVSGGQGYAVRHGRWKLVRDIPMEAPALYDLQQDPGENRDLSASHPQVCREMEVRYQNWTKRLEPPRWQDAHPDYAWKERAAAEAAGTRQYPMPWTEPSVGNDQEMP